jgi:hypothetical protein
MSVLTDEQLRELRAAGNAPVRLTDPSTHDEYVLIRAELFDRLKTLLYADGEFSASEAYPLLDEVLAKGGWDDPEMDIYNDLAPPEKS